MKFDPKKYGFKYGHLYEILATTLSSDPSKSTFIPNTASMGIRLIKGNHIKIKPYPTTQTFKNLKKFGVVTLNLVDNVYLYALASLKRAESSTLLKRFPPKYYSYKDLSENVMIKQLIDQFSSPHEYLIPYVKQAWGIIVCRVVNEKNKVKQSQIGETTLIEFELKILYEEKFSNSVKLFNRAENLALEMIILATRIKVAYNKNDQNSISELYNQILDYKAKLNRFSKNPSANKTLELIEKYIQAYIE